MTQVFQYSDLSSNQALCAITRENFTEDDSVLKIIFCGHIFKEDALREWFRRSTRCPICRHDIRLNFFPGLNSTTQS